MAMENLNKQQKEYLFIAILVLAALFIGLTKFKKQEKTDEVFSKTEFNRKWKEVEILEGNPPREEKGIDYVSLTGRDPFKSPLEEKKPAVDDDKIVLPNMRYQGMVWNSKRPQAIINGLVYDVGDEIIVGSGEEACTIRVKDVTREGIHLMYMNKEFMVRPSIEVKSISQ